jgi:uncharacterized membrane protein
MHLAQSLGLLVMPTHTGTEYLAITLRWVHFLAGITWIGLLYFFNLINVPFMKNVDAAAKPNVFKNLTLPALWWFRWSAVVTVFAGFWYWAQMYVAVDAARENASPWGTIGLFFLVWIVAFVIEYLIIVKATPANGWVVAAINAVIVTAASAAFCNFVGVGRDDNHVVAIGIGGGMGLFMMLNVWGIIWPNQKRALGLVEADADTKAKSAKMAMLGSRTNLMLSLPMLVAMTMSQTIFG